MASMDANQQADCPAVERVRSTIELLEELSTWPDAKDAYLEGRSDAYAQAARWLRRDLEQA